MMIENIAEIIRFSFLFPTVLSTICRCSPFLHVGSEGLNPASIAIEVLTGIPWSFALSSSLSIVASSEAEQLVDFARFVQGLEYSATT